MNIPKKPILETALSKFEEHPLAEMAANQISKATEGYTDSTKEIFAQAVIGINAALNGDPIDGERLIYLAFIADALERIIDGVPPAKALCLSTEGRPKKDTFARDFKLFYKVGRAYDDYLTSGSLSNSPMKAIHQSVARKNSVRSATVKQAWESLGALEAWRRLTGDG